MGVNGGLVDQAGGFSEGYEPVRGQRSQRWVVPPDESFGTYHGPASQVDLGLVVQRELFGRMVKGYAQVRQESEPLGAPAVHDGLVDGERLAQRIGDVRGRVCATKQALRINCRT